ncbi:olfactory receptor 1G1-like [Lithobates pipiens]
MEKPNYQYLLDNGGAVVAHVTVMKGNQTSQPEFILLGLSDLTLSRVPIFTLFLILNVLSLAGNLLIILLVVKDSHLQSPMYFFLGNLSAVDIFTPFVPGSHVLVEFFYGSRVILYSTCITQVFFFSWFVCTEVFLLAVMSYDRYVAICHPLHYTTIISTYLCVQLAFSAWTFGLAYSLMHTLCLLRLVFCDSPIIPGLFCELYQVIYLSCSDLYLNYLLLYLSTIYGAVVFSVTIFSYVYIFKTVLGIKLQDGRTKAFSTCISHLIVVFIFYGTSFFNYFHPKTTEFLVCRMLSIVYTGLTPFLNPIIYSLRNHELKAAVRRALVRGRLEL